MKERERHLPDSCLWTSLEQTDHDERGWKWSFQPALWFSSAVEVDLIIFCRRGRPLQLMKATVLTERSVFILFHCGLSAPAMSTDMSQVSVALFPSF